MPRSTAVIPALPILLLLLALAQPAFSQSPPDDYRWDGVRATGLTTVWVRDTAGTVTKGSLLAFTPDALVLLVDGDEQRFERSRVRRIQKRDSLKNGALIGAVTGALIGVVTMGIADCSVDSRIDGCPGLRASLVAVSAGVYAGIGVGLDAVIPGRSTIYEAPPVSSARRVRSVPTGPVLARISVSW